MLTALSSVYMRHFRTKLSLISLIGLVAKLLYAWHFSYLGQTRSSDESNYYLAGSQILEKIGLEYFLQPVSMQNAPGAIVEAYLFGSNVLGLQLVNACLVTLAAALFACVARHLHGARTGIATAVILNAYPPFIELGTTVLSEPLFIFLMAVGFFAIAVPERPMIAGICFGLACLTRPSLTVLPLFLIFAAIAAPLFKKRLALRTTLFFAAGFLLLVGPYIVKNAIHFGSPTVAYGSGAVLYLGSDPRTDGDEPVYSGMLFDTQRITRPYSHLEKDGDYLLRSAAIQQIMADPWYFSLLTVRKLGRLLFGYPDAYFHPWKTWAVERIFSTPRPSYTTLLLQALNVLTTVIASVAFVFAVFRRLNNQATSVAAFIALYFLAVHSFLFAIPRMMAPAFPFILCVAMHFHSNAPRHSRLIHAAISALTIAVILFIGHFSNPHRVHDELVDKIHIDYKASSEELNQLSVNKEGLPFVILNTGAINVSKNQLLLVEVDSFDGNAELCASAKNSLGKRSKNGVFCSFKRA